MVNPDLGNIIINRKAVTVGHCKGDTLIGYFSSKQFLLFAFE